MRFAYIRFAHRGEIIAAVLDSVLFAPFKTSVHEIRINLPAKKARKGKSKRKTQTIFRLIYGKLSLASTRSRSDVQTTFMRRHQAELSRRRKFMIITRIRIIKRNKQMKFNLESSFGIILHCFTFIKYHLLHILKREFPSAAYRRLLRFVVGRNSGRSQGRANVW